MIRLDFLGKTYRFSQPIRTLTAYEPQTVIECLQQVESASRQGYYAVGYLAYEAASAFHAYLRVPPSHHLPILWFGIYPTADMTCEETFTGGELTALPAWRPDTSQADYQRAIATIRAQIGLGNTYQTNYTIRLHGPAINEPYHYYQALVAAQQAPYGAYLDLDEQVIISASPELFFHKQGQHIMTKPMKGTAARGRSLAEDKLQQQQLFSVKNRAENMMIVDLLRNDLSQIARPGTVMVEQLFAAEKYPTVWQMTSTIAAELRPQIDMVDIFRALFPCGSITGAPKVSTMDLIARLEPTARGVYCGAIGLVTPTQEMIFNVPIRTVVIDKGQQQACYGVGGGITWDSTAADEYSEIVSKSEVLKAKLPPLQLLESLLYQQSTYSLLDYHLQRLHDSADYFDFTCCLATCKHELAAFARQLLANKAYKVRLLLDKQGHISLSSEMIAPIESPLQACWAPTPIERNNRLLYHKTTCRDFYPPATLDHEYLLFNQQDEITEFVNGNVALLIDGIWWTPPVDCGLLAGTMRQFLLEQGKLQEKVLNKTELRQASQIAFINSVRGWRDVVWC